jgi:hypothetical protein
MTVQVSEQNIKSFLFVFVFCSVLQGVECCDELLRGESRGAELFLRMLFEERDKSRTGRVHARVHVLVRGVAQVDLDLAVVAPGPERRRIKTREQGLHSVWD